MWVAVKRESLIQLFYIFQLTLLFKPNPVYKITPCEISCRPDLLSNCFQPNVLFATPESGVGGYYDVQNHEYYMLF